MLHAQLCEHLLGRPALSSFCLLESFLNRGADILEFRIVN